MIITIETIHEWQNPNLFDMDIYEPSSKSSMVSVMAFYSGVPSSKLKEGYIVNCSIISNYFANKKSIQNYG